jgi:hypothetical protein
MTVSMIGGDHIQPGNLPPVSAVIRELEDSEPAHKQHYDGKTLKN